LIAASLVDAAPLFDYRFPDSWDGAAPIVTDLSGAENHAAPTGAPVLSLNVPPLTPPNLRSANTVGGGFRTINTALLSNAAVAAAGGYRFDTTFVWNGTVAGSVQKIIDYAGTEFLQLQNFSPRGGAALLRFGFNDNTAIGPTLIAPVIANQWYRVTGIFNTDGNAVDIDGNLAGTATLIVNDIAVSSEPVVKTVFGDSLNRPTGIGNFSNAPSGVLQFRGDIFSASITLGAPVPEPATALLAAAMSAGVASFFRRRR
jgi:hypothetical protein